MKPYAGYIRVSARANERDEAGKLHSPDWQRAKIERLEVDVEFFAPELDVSGSKAKRPILEQIIQGVERGDYAGIAIDKLDRLSRLAPRERIDLFDRIETAGGRVISASENIDPSTPEGRFARDVFLGVARMQWERFRDNYARAKEHAHNSGMKIGPTPFGYQRRADNTLEPHPTEAPIVKEAYRLAAAQGIQAARLYLDSLELIHQNGRRAGQRRSFGRSTAHARRLLANRVYLGEQVYSGLKTVLDAHEALVDQMTWLAAQTTGRAIAPKATRPLVGLIYCANCGAHMVASRGGSAQNEPIIVYRCSNGQSYLRADRRCKPAVVIVAHTVEQYLREQLAEILPNVTLTQGSDDAYAAAHADADAARLEMAAYQQHAKASLPGYAEGFAEREAALIAAEAAERQAAKATATKRQVQFSRDAILDADDATLRDIVSVSGIRIEISSGRGIPVGDRVRMIIGHDTPNATEATL